MADDDVENYVDSIVEKKLKKLGFAGDISALGGIGVGVGRDRDIVTERAPSHLKELIGEIKVVKELSDVTRGDLDKVISEGIKQKMAETIIPVLFGGNKSAGPWDSFMQALGNKAGESMPALLDIAFSRLGKDGTDKVLDILGNKMGGSGGSGGSEGGGGSGGSIGSVENTIISLDPDNPNHLHYYMSIRGMSGVSVDDAKKSLIAEKAILMEKERMKTGEGGGGGGSKGGENVGGVGGMSSNLESAIMEQNVYLEKIIKRQNQSDEVIKFLVEKIEKMDGEKRGTGDVIGRESMGRESIENKSEDIIIAEKISDSWEKDIEKNKEMIRKKNEEDRIKKEEEEKIKKEEERIQREKEDRERVAVVGRIGRSNPVFETNENISNIIEKEA